MITFDLDGVIRDLGFAVFGRVPNDWNETINGKGVVEIINENLNLLDEAPPTKYYSVIKEMFPIPHILTHQSKKWRTHTEAWLGWYFGFYDVQYTKSGIDDKADILEDGFLVDDYPLFPKDFYKKVILVRYPYNENIKEEDCYAVVNSGEELREVLKWTLVK